MNWGRVVLVLCLVAAFSSRIFAEDSLGPKLLKDEAGIESSGASDGEPGGSPESIPRWSAALRHLFSFRSELSAISTYHDKKEFPSFISLRYVPELKLSTPINETFAFDADAAFDANATFFFDPDYDSDTEAGADVYRLYGKLVTNQSEVCVGLQEINFGPARILRSLMWFDQIDPFDPLERTDGVKALLMRYFFLNNANIWLWGLYGNDDLKGMESIKSKENTIEFGGRCQVPLPNGEMALSYHQRHLDPDDWLAKKSTVLDNGVEQRLALDGFWDIKIGLWFEFAGSETRFALSRNLTGEYETCDFCQTTGTVGSDYTLKNGLHLLGEFFSQASGKSWGDLYVDSKIATVSTDYNFSNIDKVIATAIYDITSDGLRGVLQWQRNYDSWKLDLNIFTNTEHGDNSESGAITGNGFIVMFTYYQ